MRPIYLDHAATTPVDARVAAAMAECLTADGTFGNPSSPHRYGRAAHERIEHARMQVAQLIGARPADVLFTSGATESNNLAILGSVRGSGAANGAGGATRGAGPGGVGPGHVVTSRTEHRSVLDACRQLEREGYDVSYLEPDGEGIIDPAAVAAALRAETRLVSIMHANNEIGVLQDVAAIAAACHARGVALHVDGAQSVGKVGLDVAALHVDLLSFTAHKLYGPKGIGALYARPAQRARLQPLLFGGGQERGIRSGTLAVHQIVGFGLACELAGIELSGEAERLRQLTELLWRGLSELPGVRRNGHAERRVPGLLNVSFEGIEGESLLAGLSELALSSGSACDSDSDEPSHVLRSLGRARELAHSSLRFSLGRTTDLEQVQRAVAIVGREVRRLWAAARGPMSAAIRVNTAVAATSDDGLPPKVRALFADLTHAGDLEGPGPGADPAAGNGGDGAMLCAEAGSRAEGAQVRLTLRVVGGRIGEARYRAYGCPYTLAVCEWLARRLPGLSVPSAGDLGDAIGHPVDWAAALEVPAARLGRLLTIEDALRGCLLQRSVTASSGRLTLR